jgi:hypothetical protein
MRIFLMTAAAAFFPLAALMVSTEAANAVQDTPTAINGVETVCTGVGSAKDDPRWGAYPIKVVLATAGGANLANAHVSLSQNGKEVAGLDCDAPWILFKAPPGNYRVTGTLIGGSGRSNSANVTAGTAQKEVTLIFSRPTPPAQ